jgi:hypothetical protein
MNNNRYLGIVFRKGSDCGIAKITVYNTTRGQWLDETGTLSNASSYRLYDTYLPSSGYTVLEKDQAYWISLITDENYEITIEHNGTHNASASLPYGISIVNYLDTVPLVDGYFQKTLQVSHSVYSSTGYTLDITNDIITPIEVISYFNGDDSTTTFSIGDVNHAKELLQVSADSGTNWWYPWDTRLTWGSNSPNYDNETLTNAGYFSVNFSDAPATGVNNVQIKWLPLIDQYMIQTVSHQPTTTDEEYTNRMVNIRQLDFAFEVFE